MTKLKIALVMTLCATSHASPQLRLVDLEMVAPTPRSAGVPTTGMVRTRSAPPDGIRERDHDIAVTTVCGDHYCVDGLVDQRARRVLLSTDLHADEREILATPGGTVQRVIKLAYVGERFISIYIGDSTYSGGVHHNQSLACATFDRTTQRRIRLPQLIASRAPQLLGEARSLAESFQGSHDYPPDERSFRLTPTEFVLCAAGRPPRDGTMVEIPFPR